MSVLTIEPEVFNYVCAGLERAAYNTQVDEFYYSPVQYHFSKIDIEKEAIRLVRSWADMNMKSFCYKYKEEFVSLSCFIKRTLTAKELTPVQLLKYVECISYNIEPEWWELSEVEKSDLELLHKIEISIVKAIVRNTESYKKAEWSKI